MARYIVKETDLIGSISNYPIEIVQQMVEHAEEQGNTGEKAIKAFQVSHTSSYYNGGFDWDKTKHEDFWFELKNAANFMFKEQLLEKFYREYPKVKVPSYTFPRIMEVSDFEDFCDLNRRVVIAKHNGMFIAWRDATNFEDAESKVSTKPWRYAREIDDSIIELTIEEIAEKLNIDSSKLRIKK